MPKKSRKTTRMTPGFTGPFKGDPQPGTLFDKRALDQLPGNVEATRNRPGPRGYSPGRLAEVRGAFDAAYTIGGGKNERTQPVEVGGPPVNVLNEAAHQYGPSSHDPANPRYGRARSRILDTLSRSTINVSDEMENPLTGLGRIETRLAGGREYNIAGEYTSSGGYDQPDESGWRRAQGPTIKLYANSGSNQAMRGQDEAAEQTLLHELGHHESWISASESSRYETPRQKAREEARADKFALTHFRRDPRNKGAYDPREHTYMARGLAGAFESPADYQRNFPAEMRPPARNPNIQRQQFDQGELFP